MPVTTVSGTRKQTGKSGYVYKFVHVAKGHFAIPGIEVNIRTGLWVAMNGICFTTEQISDWDFTSDTDWIYSQTGNRFESLSTDRKISLSAIKSCDTFQATEYESYDYPPTYTNGNMSVDTDTGKLTYSFDGTGQNKYMWYSGRKNGGIIYSKFAFNPVDTDNGNIYLVHHSEDRAQYMVLKLSQGTSGSNNFSILKDMIVSYTMGRNMTWDDFVADHEKYFAGPNTEFYETHLYQHPHVLDNNDDFSLLNIYEMWYPSTCSMNVTVEQNSVGVISKLYVSGVNRLTGAPYMNGVLYEGNDFTVCTVNGYIYNPSGTRNTNGSVTSDDYRSGNIITTTVTGMSVTSPIYFRQNFIGDYLSTFKRIFDYDSTPNKLSDVIKTACNRRYLQSYSRVSPFNDDWVWGDDGPYRAWCDGVEMKICRMLDGYYDLPPEMPDVEFSGSSVTVDFPTNGGKSYSYLEAVTKAGYKSIRVRYEDLDGNLMEYAGITPVNPSSTPNRASFAFPELNSTHSMDLLGYLECDDGSGTFSNVIPYPMSVKWSPGFIPVIRFSTSSSSPKSTWSAGPYTYEVHASNDISNLHGCVERPQNSFSYSPSSIKAEFMSKQIRKPNGTVTNQSVNNPPVPGYSEHSNRYFTLMFPTGTNFPANTSTTDTEIWNYRIKAKGIVNGSATPEYTTTLSIHRQPRTCLPVIIRLVDMYTVPSGYNENNVRYTITVKYTGTDYVDHLQFFKNTFDRNPSIEPVYPYKNVLVDYYKANSATKIEIEAKKSYVEEVGYNIIGYIKPQSYTVNSPLTENTVVCKINIGDKLDSYTGG